MSNRSKRGNAAPRKAAGLEVATPAPSDTFQRAYSQGKRFCERVDAEELAEAIKGFKAGVVAHMARVEQLNTMALNELDR
jgi:hypothetical protein